MYKKLLPLLLLTGSSLASFAQAPTLTAANFNPQLNDGFINIVCDTTGVLPGAAGASVTWNFSGLTFTQQDTAKAVSVTSTTAAAAILFAQPATNIAVVTPTASMTIYSIENTTKLSTTGYYQSSAQNAVYTDPMDQIHYPFTYKSAFTDSYAGTVTFGGTPITESGSTYDTSDGWGTLILPGSLSYTNVLRVHSTQIYTDVANLFGTGTSSTFDLESYDWYVPNYHSAVLTVSTASGTGFASGYYFKTVSYSSRQISNASVHTVSGIDASLQVFPNPVSNEMNVNFNAGTGANIRITLADMLGRDVAVIADQYAQGMQNFTYNTSALPKGLYLVRLQSGADNVTRKVVVQ